MEVRLALVALREDSIAVVRALVALREDSTAVAPARADLEAARQVAAVRVVARVVGLVDSTAAVVPVVPASGRAGRSVVVVASRISAPRTFRSSRRRMHRSPRARSWCHEASRFRNSPRS